jgi:hypothetical protein
MRGSPRRILWAAVVAAGLTIAIAAATLVRRDTPGPTAGSAAAETAGPAGAAGRQGEAARESDLSPERRQQLYDARVEGLRERVHRTRDLVGRFPRELVDVDALARNLATSEAAFAFVRDQLAFEPYPGVMKGAAGTLVSRGGNAIDRAILLADILARHGVTCRIAHGMLSRDRAEALLAEIEHAPDAVAQMASTLTTLPEAPAISGEQREAAGALLASARASGLPRHEQAAANARMITASLRSARVAAVREARESQLRVLQDHFWLQATIEGRLVDLDPSFKTATMNRRFADPAVVFAPNAVPSDVYQRVGIRAVADVLENGAVTRRDLVAAEARAADLLDRNIRVVVEPQALSREQNGYTVTVTMGDASPRGASLELRSAPRNAGAVGGLLGGLGGDETTEPTPQNPAGAVLGRLAIEIVLAAPTVGETRYRRVIVDRLDGEPQSPHLLSGMEDDDSVRSLMVQVWDGAIDVGASHPLRLFASHLEAFTSEQLTAEQALAEVYLDRAMPKGSSGSPQVAPELVALFLYSNLTRHALAAATTAKRRVYQLRPRLGFRRRGVVVHDWSNPAGQRRIQESIDLINLPYDVVGGHDSAADLRVTIGVADTALERALAGPSGDFNTIPLVEATLRQQIAFVTLSPANPAAIDGMALPPAIRRVLQDALDRGQTLIAPSALVAVNGVRTYGWWSVDPESGVPLGQMELGAGQAVSETAALNKALLTGGHTFAKFYGGMLGCFYVEAADQLVPPDGPYQVTPTFNWSKGHYMPGLPTIASGHGLAACLVEKICEAVIEYAFLAAESAAWVGDVTHLQHQLIEMLGLIGPTAVSTWMGACTPGDHPGSTH